MKKQAPSDITPPTASAQQPPTPTLRQLACFKEVAAHRSFSRAAVALAMSQPALSSAIRELESVMGATLFDRSTHHVRLSPAGEAIRTQVEWMLNNYQQGVQDLQQLLKYQTDTLRIACIPSSAHLAAPWIAQWQEEHPMVLLHWSDMNNEAMVAATQSGEIDIGLGLDFTVPSSLETHFVAEDDIIAVVPAGHPLAQRSALQWSDLRSEPLAMLSHGSTHQMISHMLEQQGVGLMQMETVAYTESLYAMVRSGLRIGLLSRLYAQSHRPEGVVTLALRSPQLSRRICLMTRKSTGRRAVIQDGWDYLCAHMGATALKH
ncbi:LysR family transcriptional regulator [Comamonas humi]